MNLKSILIGASLACLFGFTSSNIKDKYPEALGWMPAGSKPEAYDMGTDSSTAFTGNNSATIKSIKKKIKGFGTLLQSQPAKTYHGKRLRLTCAIKCQNVKKWAGLWMRLDGYDKEGKYEMTGFDNMQGRPIKGTQDWKKYSVVLDVPDNTKGIYYGVLLDGTGQVWFDDMEFDVVDVSVPTTGNPSKPNNLDFENK